MFTKVNKWAQSAHDWVLPPTCVLCGRAGLSELDLCQCCARELPYIQGACLQCAIPLPAAGRCGQCQQHAPSFDGARAVFHYSDPIDHLIQALKFNSKLYSARLLGRLMADYLLPHDGEPLDLPEAIVPVPLHPNRLRQRGFNQALELARPLSKLLAIPILPRLCQRQRETASQTGLDAKARRRNLKGAFSVSPLHDLKRVLIVDDVMTTGSTAELMASALKKAGAERVDVWVCARADLPGMR